jgi:hypothetical protein
MAVTAVTAVIQIAQQAVAFLMVVTEVLVMEA